MTRVYETVREAAELWVSQFNAIPQGMLDRLIRENTDEWREEYGFQIGKRASHAYGLGNNAQLPIFYNDGDEMQECCYFNCNIDPFGVCYMSIEDYNGRRIAGAYEVYAKR